MGKVTKGIMVMVYKIFKNNIWIDVNEIEWLRFIPSGCIGNVHCDVDLLGKVIKWWTGGPSSHSFFYVGSGNNKIIEATVTGCRINYLSKYLKDEYQIRVYVNERITTVLLQVLKEVFYEKAGLRIRYGFKTFVSFVWSKLFGRITHDPEPDREICSEVIVDGFGDSLNKKLEEYGMQKVDYLRIVPDKQPFEVSPSDIDRYMTTEEAYKNGWRLIALLNCLKE